MAYVAIPAARATSSLPVLNSVFTSIMNLGDSTILGSGSTNGYPATAGNAQIMMGIGGGATQGSNAYLDALFDLMRLSGNVPVGSNGSGTDTEFFRGAVASDTFNRVSRQHEGHNGWGLSTTGGFVAAGSAIASQFAAIWAAKPAAAIVLIAGINELNNGATGAQAAASLTTCLQQIVTTAGNNIPVLFVKPPMGSGVSAKEAAWSAAADTVVASQAATGQKVWSANAGGALKDGNGGTAGAMFFDTLHLNYHGGRALAGIVWKGLLAYPY